MSEARFHHDALCGTGSRPRRDLALNQESPDSRQVRHSEAGSNHGASSSPLMSHWKDEDFSLAEGHDRRLHRVGSKDLSTVLTAAEMDE